MISLLIAFALQASAPAAQPNPEQVVRRTLAAQGMSPIGIETIITTEKRHTPTIRAIVTRGQAAQTRLGQVMAARPIDPEAFATVSTARTEAATALQRETTQIGIEQIRALSPADRVVLAQAMASAAARRAAAPTKR